MKAFYTHLQTIEEIKRHHENENFVEYRRVISKAHKKIKATVIIFPPTGGENIVDRLYARDLALLGYEVFIIRNWTNYDIDGTKYELHNVFYHSAQNALNQILKIKSSKKVGLLGTSVGALHSSVALTMNDAIDAGFLIVGGLTIPEVIVHSSQEDMKKLKARRYKEYNLTNDTQYLQQLSQIFELEPTALQMNKAKGKPVGMIVSTNDRLVPYENQEKASEFFQARPLYKTSLSHVKAVAWYGLLRRNKVLNFFKNHLR